MDVAANRGSASIDLARQFCAGIESLDREYWVMSGFEGLREGESRDLDVLLSEALDADKAIRCAKESAEAVGWEFLGLEIRGYGNHRLFFVNTARHESFEIDLLPDFMFGPVDLCEGARQTVQIDGFSICENARFSKAVLSRFLSGNFDSVKVSDRAWARHYLNSASGQGYLKALLGEEIHAVVDSCIQGQHNLEGKSKKALKRRLIFREMGRSPWRFVGRFIRWVYFDLCSRGFMGPLAPVLRIGNADADTAQSLAISLESELRSLIPFSKLGSLREITGSKFSTVKRSLKSMGESVNLVLPVEFSRDRGQVPHLLARGHRIYLDAKRFDRQSDLDAFRQIARSAFQSSLRDS